MRILIAHASYRIPGGEDSYVKTQVELLSKGHDVYLLQASNEDLSGKLEASARGATSFGSRRSTTETIESFQPDVIHVHNIYPALGPVVHQIAKRNNIPLVMTVHNYRLRCPNGVRFTDGEICDRCVSGRYYNAVTHPCFPTRNQRVAYATTLWMHRFINRLEKSVDIFIAPSAFMGRKLTEWGVEESRIRTIRYAVNDPGPPPTRMGECGGYLGRLSMEKGVDVLLHALREAGDPPFLIAGDGTEKAALVDLATRLDLKNVEFLGYLPRPSRDDFFRRTRFLVFPSVWDENNPLAACEAMSRGMPIIVSDRGGLPELAMDGRGIICRSGEVLSFASSISQLMGDEELRAQLGAASVAFARSEFTMSKHKERLISTYEGILTRR